jgi:putative sigma-54 modulation protein
VGSVQVIINTRGLSISTTYREALTRKLQKLDRLLPKLIEAKIVLSREKHRRTAGLTLIAKSHTFRSEETAEDLAAAVDLAIAALTRQVRETKDRIRKPKPRRATATPTPREASAPSPETAVVVRQVTPKPMSVEEAADQFRLSRDQFLVFTNAGTDTINVVYRRKDGGLGLIEPVA